MSESYTPWEELFGPSAPENVVPVTPPPIFPTIPDPVNPQPIPVPITPYPIPTPSPTVPTTPQKSNMSMLIAATIVAVGMVGAGYFVSAKGTKPFPTPNPVVVPSGPVVDATLAPLLPTPEARGMVASYFRDVSKFLETSKTLQTSGQVRDAIQAGTKDLQAAIGASGWSAINTPISNRVIKAMGSTPEQGLPDVSLDQPHLNGMTPRQIMVKEYSQIGIDARGG